METKNVIPIQASADGVLNGYTFRCRSTDQSMYYSVCLARLAKNDPNFPGDCGRSMRSYGCPAKAMRQEEKDAGFAIYFRRRVNTIFDQGRQWLANLAAGRLTTSAPVAVTEGIAPKSSGDDLLSEIEGATTSYAEVINKAMTEGVTVKGTCLTDTDKRCDDTCGECDNGFVVQPPVKPGIEPGESMLAYARRLKAAGF